MVYLYAALGVVMMTGIMAIFEMGLSLTGQSLLPGPANEYVSDTAMKNRDKALLDAISHAKFVEAVAKKGLCAALKEIEIKGKGSWSLVAEPGFWNGSCQFRSDGDSHRIVVRNDTYQLFSCALRNGATKCSFETK